MHPTLEAGIFGLLEVKILAGKKATGRTGMDLWQILVLGVVRLGLDADWDRMEHSANHDTLVRQMLGVPAMPWGEDAREFGQQTLRDNVALLDDELLQQINAQRRRRTRGVRKKRRRAPRGACSQGGQLRVGERPVGRAAQAGGHFPTDFHPVR